jgi:thymidylate kinase
MIIIEGPDGAGKSTLCGALKNSGIVDKVLPSPRITSKGDPDRMKYETRRYLHLYGQNHTIAVDRFLFSEMVYGKVLRGKSSFSRLEYLNTLLEIMTTGSIVIFCLPEKLNFKKDENPRVIESIEQLRKEYEACVEDSAFSTSRTYVYKWDEKRSFDRVVKFIRENQ